MTKRSAITVLLLGAITCGIYTLIWLLGTKDEMNARGAQIPPGWHLLIPILNVVWLWKWAQGAEQVTHGKVSASTVMLASIFFGPAVPFIVVGPFNEVS
ncbi:MAG: DUF4234 domain-containing protein [Polyangiaceae bacterium]